MGNSFALLSALVLVKVRRNRSSFFHHISYFNCRSVLPKKVFKLTAQLKPLYQDLSKKNAKKY